MGSRGSVGMEFQVLSWAPSGLRTKVQESLFSWVLRWNSNRMHWQWLQSYIVQWIHSKRRPSSDCIQFSARFHRWNPFPFFPRTDIPRISLRPQVHWRKFLSRVHLPTSERESETIRIENCERWETIVESCILQRKGRLKMVKKNSQKQ